VLLFIAFPSLKQGFATLFGVVVVVLGGLLVMSGNLDLNSNVEMILVLLAVGVGVGAIHRFLRRPKQPPPPTTDAPGANQQMMFDSLDEAAKGRVREAQAERHRLALIESIRQQKQTAGRVLMGIIVGIVGVAVLVILAVLHVI